LCISGINGIEGCINLKTLNLEFCESLTGLFSGHHPVMAADFWCITEVPSSISELKKLEILNLSYTGITGTVDFDHHPMMITDFLLCIPDINGIEGCINLKILNLMNCSSLTGLFSGHHPMMIADSCCAFQTSMELKDAPI
jgi:Leucine-rich repeat (LRR) protein